MRNHLENGDDGCAAYVGIMWHTWQPSWPVSSCHRVAQAVQEAEAEAASFRLPLLLGSRCVAPALVERERDSEKAR